MKNMNQVFAMYDVRGIQDYIFRTPKLKHAIGASAIVESIIEKALEYAVEKYAVESVSSDLEWENKEYDGIDKDVQVLYVGGGNAFVLYRDRELYLEVTKIMAKYVMEKTYSLQLAATCVEKTDSYKNDYRNLNLKMTKVKADMPESKPVGALPIMKIELATGLPVITDDISKETQLKLAAEKEERALIKSKNKKFDEYIEEKGEDSTLAIIHIDGNNMGLRIRELIENKETYVEAVNEMRNISYNINHSYKEVFDDMKEAFNKREKYVVLPVLTAGDDITYVCSGKAAIASVEYFVNGIKKKSMTGRTEDIEKYGFSVCGGIAFIRSHFPFSIGYEVAEACCESAKDRAKTNLNDKGMVGNFFDFQFCKNVQTINIDNIRQDEYITPTNEELLSRPFEIGGDKTKYYSYEDLKRYINIFNESSGKKDSKSASLPRTHAKKLRNTYPLGYSQVDSFVRFLKSRNWKLPAGDCEPYVLVGDSKIAKYYDALELMDMYEDIETIIGE